MIPFYHVYTEHIEQSITWRLRRFIVETIEVSRDALASRGLEKYVRPRDVVEATGLAKSTVAAALRSGELKGLRYGRAWLIPVSAVEEWLLGDGEQAT